MKINPALQRRICTVLIGCVPLLASAQTTQSAFSITGKFPVPDSTVVVMENVDTREQDSAYAMNGAFHFQGHLEYPALFSFRGLDYEQQRDFFNMQTFVENANILIEEKDGIVQVKGSATQHDKQALIAKLRVVWKEFDAVLNLSEYSREDSLQLEKYIETYKATTTGFYKNNPDSYFTGHALMIETIRGAKAHKKLELSKKEIRDVYITLTDKIKNSPYGQAVKRYITLPDVPEVGEPYSDFALSDTKGTTVKLSDFRGKYIFVDFWASWCTACRAQTPRLKALHEKFSSNNVEFIGVSIDSNRDAWIKAVEKDELMWINLLSPGGRTSEASQLYGINGLPDNLLINPDGVIVKRNIKPEALEQYLAGLFSKQ